MECTVRVVCSDPVRTFWHSAIALLLFGPGIAAPYRDAKFADQPALAVDRHEMGGFIDADQVDRARIRALASARAVIPGTAGLEAGIDRRIFAGCDYAGAERQCE